MGIVRLVQFSIQIQLFLLGGLSRKKACATALRCRRRGRSYGPGKATILDSAPTEHYFGDQRDYLSSVEKQVAVSDTIRSAKEMREAESLRNDFLRIEKTIEETERVEQERVETLHYLIGEKISAEVQRVRDLYVPYKGNEEYLAAKARRESVQRYVFNWGLNTMVSIAAQSQLAEDMNGATVRDGSLTSYMKNNTGIGMTPSETTRMSTQVGIDIVAKGFLVVQRSTDLAIAIADWKAAEKEEQTIGKRVDAFEHIFDFSSIGEAPPLIQSFRMLSILLTGRGCYQVLRLITAGKSDLGQGQDSAVNYMKQYFAKRLDVDLLSEEAVRSMNDVLNTAVYDDLLTAPKESFSQTVRSSAANQAKHEKIRAAVAGARLALSVAFLAGAWAYIGVGVTAHSVIKSTVGRIIYDFIFYPGDVLMTNVFGGGRRFVDMLIGIFSGIVPGLRSGFDEEMHSRILEAIAAMEAEDLQQDFLQAATETVTFVCTNKEGDPITLTPQEVRHFLAYLANWKDLKDCDVFIDTVKAKTYQPNSGDSGWRGATLRGFLKFFVDGVIVGASEKAVPRGLDSLVERSEVNDRIIEILQRAHEAKKTGHSLLFRADRFADGLELVVLPTDKLPDWLLNNADSQPRAMGRELFGTVFGTGLYKIKQGMNTIIADGIVPAISDMSWRETQWAKALNPLNSAHIFSNLTLPYKRSMWQATWAVVPVVPQNEENVPGLSLLGTKVLNQICNTKRHLPAVLHDRPVEGKRT